MDFSTLVFDFAAAVGGVYILFGLLLHLIEAWQSCGTTVTAPGPVLRIALGRHERSEPRATTTRGDWERQLGLT
ncbi:MAG: hypothetical protein WBA10_13930 [Elainellaceae cyanobacterium]